MQPKEWQEENYNDIDDYFDSQKKKNSKQSKRKWREIEAFKEQKRMQREIAAFDDYVMHWSSEYNYRRYIAVSEYIANKQVSGKCKTAQWI